MLTYIEVGEMKTIAQRIEGGNGNTPLWGSYMRSGVTEFDDRFY